jgi:hypothetical protein
MLGELGDRPVLIEVKPASLTLMVGQDAAVDIQKTLAAARAVRARRRRVGVCQGQGLDIVTELRVPRSRAQAKRDAACRRHRWLSRADQENFHGRRPAGDVSAEANSAVGRRSGELAGGELAATPRPRSL